MRNQIYPHQYHHGFTQLRLHGMWGMYFCELFRRVATNLVGLFVPIYIWQHFNSLIFVIIYYLIFAFIGMVLMYPGALLIRKIGIDWGAALGSLCRALYIASLIFTSIDTRFFWISAFFFGLAQPFDWLPYHYAVTKTSQKDHYFGKAAGMSITIAQVGHAVGPILGGVIIALLGFNWLYLIAGSLLIVAAIAPFIDTFDKTGMHVSGKEIITRLTDPGIGKHLLANGLEAFDLMAQWIIWPLFLFSMVKSFESSGTLQTLSLLMALIFTIIAGRQSDKKRLWPMTCGTLLVSLSWWGRVVSPNNLSLFIANTGHTVGSCLLWTPYMALMYAKSSQQYTMEFWLVKEIIHYGAIMVSLGIVAVFLHFGSLKAALILFGVINLLSFSLPHFYKHYLSIQRSKPAVS